MAVTTDAIAGNDNITTVPRQESLVAGFIGPRGSGKTLTLAWLGLKDMANGIPVLANFQIKGPFRKGNEVVNVESLPLDLPTLLTMSQEIRRAIAIIDEINLWFENTKWMTNGNRLISIFLQQIRKRELSVYYSTQNFKWADGRIRWQTDILTRCQDIAKTPMGMMANVKRGEFISLQTIDFSGYITGQPWDEKKGGHIFPSILEARPIWDCYDTTQIVNPWEAMAKVELKRPKLTIDITGDDEDEQGLLPTPEEVEEWRRQRVEDIKEQRRRALEDSGYPE